MSSTDPTTPAKPTSTAKRNRARSLRRPITALGLLAVAALSIGCFDQSGRGVFGLGEQAFGEVRTDLSCDELTGLAQAQLEWAMADMTAVETSDDLMSDAAPDASTLPQPDSAGRAAEGGTTPPSTVASGDEAGSGEVIAGTNVRELGVDESDIVKTDGELIVSVQDGTLRVVGLDGTPALDGTLLVSEPGSATTSELFLRGDEALVVLWSYGGDVIMDDRGTMEGDTQAPQTTTSTSTTTPLLPAPPFDEGVTLIRVDLSDPTHPSELERTTVEGSLVAARMIDGTARVVVRSTPAIVQDMWAAGDEAERREVIDAVEVEDLLPRITSDGSEDGVASLGECSDVAVLPVGAMEPDEPVTTGLGSASAIGDPTTVSVLTVGDTLGELSPTTVQGLADVVYASPSALFLTSNDWSAAPVATAVHRFDITGEGAAAYTGSATVAGVVLDDYSLSEADGDLRVVTTVDTFEEPVDTTLATPEDDVVVITPSGPGGDVGDVAPAPTIPSTEGRLTVLRPDESGALKEISHVADLGEGERVQSVRYVGDLAYVVTFRQTDPLYAIDLSDPSAPKVLGELKVTGFSQYLHPVGEDRLLGIGREADESGVDHGFKVSLFDVSDPTAPTELDKIVIPDGWSLAADDPHAFTWDPLARHAVFPVERSGFPNCGDGDGEGCAAPMPTNGALVVAVEGDTLVEVAELRHADTTDPVAWQAGILRSLVVDRDLWTYSPIGLGLSDADVPTGVELIRF
jgi:hypothetical protein